jgi:hypothetical protein
MLWAELRWVKNNAAATTPSRTQVFVVNIPDLLKVKGDGLRAYQAPEDFGIPELSP